MKNKKLWILLGLSAGLFALLYWLKTIDVVLAAVAALVIFAIVFVLCIAVGTGKVITQGHREQPLRSMFPLTELEKSFLPDVPMDATDAEKRGLVEAVYDVTRLAPDAQVEAMRQDGRRRRAS